MLTPPMVQSPSWQGFPTSVPIGWNRVLGFASPARNPILIPRIAFVSVVAQGVLETSLAQRRLHRVTMSCLPRHYKKFLMCVFLAARRDALVDKSTSLLILQSSQLRDLA